MNVRVVEYNENVGHAIRRVRSAVFTDEQGISPEMDFDGKDPKAVHAIAYVDGQNVGTGRMLSDGKIGRVAVIKEYRKSGLGSKIIGSLVERAKANNCDRVYLSSQKSAIGFYLKLGFEAVGEEFVEADIIHQNMEMLLGKKSN